MKVIVRKCEMKKGVSTMTGNPYLFTSALVMFDDNVTADWVTIDADVCHPDKIKPGVKADMYLSQSNNKRVTLFEPYSEKSEGELSPANFTVDPVTGEAREKNKK